MFLQINVIYKRTPTYQLNSNPYGPTLYSRAFPSEKKEKREWMELEGLLESPLILRYIALIYTAWNVMHYHSMGSSQQSLAQYILYILGQ